MTFEESATHEIEESDYDEAGDCKQCGEPEGQHDRSCGVGYDEWCARVDDAYCTDWDNTYGTD